MKSPIPPNAERIQIGGETAWLWETRSDWRDPKGFGWSVLQGPYRVDLENIERDGRRWHTIDWSNRVPPKEGFEGGLERYEPGHLDRARFLEVAETIVAVLRRRDAPPSPPS